jgi:hypothetical protein
MAPEIAERFNTLRKNEGMKEAIIDLHNEYGLDQQELGKIIFITSFAMLVVAAPSALTLQEASDELKKAETDLTRAEAVIQDRNFQRSLDQVTAVVQGSGLSRNLNNMADAVNSSAEAVGTVGATQDNIEQRAETYKWVSLISLIGIVAGLVTIYV